MIPALFDHLWQSTLVVGAAGVLALALRRHSARARYWTWLAASVKFLIPFSLLESAGSWLAPRFAAPVLSLPVTDAVNWISTPFVAAISPPGATATAAGTISRAAAATRATAPITPVSAAMHLASSLSPHLAVWLMAVWLAGIIVVVSVWAVRWIRLSAIVQAARTVAMQAPVPVRIPATSPFLHPVTTRRSTPKGSSRYAVSSSRLRSPARPGFRAPISRSASW